MPPPACIGESGNNHSRRAWVVWMQGMTGHCSDGDKDKNYNGEK